MNKLVNCGLENRFGTNCLKWDGLKVDLEMKI